MSRPFDHSARTSDIALAIAWLIIDGGIARVTMRNVARKVGMSLGTLTNHLTTKQRMLAVCAQSWGRRRLDRLWHRTGFGGLDGFLPTDENELAEERVWLAWRELSRSDDLLAEAFAEVDTEEAWLLAKRLEHEETTLEPETLDVLSVVIRGLREAVCARGEAAMAPDRAREILAYAVDRFVRTEQPVRLAAP